MNRSSELFRMVCDRCAAWLVPMGFERCGNAFRYRRSDVDWHVEIVRSEWTSPEHLRFSIVVGVYAPKIAAVLGDRSPDDWSAVRCHWHENLGALATVGQDIWWLIHSESQLAETVAVIEWLFRTQAIPAFKQFGTFSRLVESWGTWPNVARMAAVGRYIAAVEARGVDSA
ncbi:MAG: DUF4304 domain-containing protein [Fimbriimonadaceae bacterium]